MEANKMRPTAKPLAAVFSRGADRCSDASVICRSLLVRAASQAGRACGRGCTVGSTLTAEEQTGITRNG
jgi:hypothetical protein